MLTGKGVWFKPPEAVSFGVGVFTGTQACLQGRHDGRCMIGNHLWFRMHADLDACGLALEDYVEWGPRAKVLRSPDTGVPAGVPIVRTELGARWVRVEERVDVGTGSALLSGLAAGKSSLVGTAAVVIRDVPPHAKAEAVAGPSDRSAAGPRVLFGPGGIG